MDQLLDLTSWPTVSTLSLLLGLVPLFIVWKIMRPSEKPAPKVPVKFFLSFFSLLIWPLDFVCFRSLAW